MALNAGPPVFHHRHPLGSRIQALRDLRAWYEEWSEVARAVVKRRDYLIQMGLAKKKSEKKGATPANPEIRKDDRYA